MIEKIGRYQIVDKLGEGGMAVVFRGLDPAFNNREVAIKVLPQQHRQEPTYRQRFQREAQTIAELEHTAIVPVYDYGEDDGRPFFVMRLMHGGSLAERLEKGALSIAEIQHILDRVGSAIDKAHQLGVIHRDLKPANILFDEDGEPYLSDFGIVKVSEATNLTRSGGIIGTPAYMSPEQVLGEKDIDGRTDIYAMGAILFQMLSGHLPYESDSTMGMAMSHVTRPVPQLQAIDPNLPAPYQAVIAAAMAKERSQRFPSGLAMADAFRQATKGLGVIPIPVDATVIEPYAAVTGSKGQIAHAQPGPTKPTPPPVTESQKNRSMPKILGGIFAVLLLILLGVFTIFSLGDNSGQENEDGASVAAESVQTQTSAAQRVNEGSIPSGQEEEIQPVETERGEFDAADSTNSLQGENLESVALNSLGAESAAPSNTPSPTDTPQPIATPFPTDTPQPTVTPLPTSTPLSTSTPLPTNTPAPSAQVVEGFEYASSGALYSAYFVNAPGNELTLSLTSSPVGGNALVMDYRILNDPPSDYVGIEGNRAPMDWRNFSKLCLWLQNDGYQGHMVLQFREMNGETWKTEIPLRNMTSGTVCLNLNENTFFRASHSANQNGVLDLAAIENIAFYLGAGGRTEGRFLIDSVRLSN